MAIGTFAQLGIDSANPVTKQFDFISGAVSAEGRFIDPNGIRGTRSRAGERVRDDGYDVRGTIVMEPGPEELALLLPWILGAVASGTTYALAETVPERYITIDKVSKVMTYAGCKVSRAVFSASEGQALRLSLDIIGKTETVAAAASFPAISASLQTSGPFIFSDAALTANAAGSRKFKAATLTVDNMLVAIRNNSLTNSTISEQDRLVTLAIDAPYDSTETDLYNLAVAGAAASLVYTHTGGAYSLTFDLALWQVPRQVIDIPGKSEIHLPLEGVARKSGSTKELIVTLDSTP